ncbi:MmcQ/YjbR family DNA-binding protein [Anaerosinus massiliensis]|uniref:MmcQ/YjbR family DNA-binding protein n=1 Tax=Massilibacillus massiliensis TaxID=1806837 RepID=UPI0018FEF595|nr:MmcQ/YjbR family DNA-binding protein [Massilibacillus massiliensis]
MNRKDIFSYVKYKFNTTPIYKWMKQPNYAVLQHEVSGKWYGLIMNIPKSKIGLGEEEMIDILNVKCDPDMREFLRNEEGILPAYHMNKEHWLSIVLESSFPKNEIYNLIDISYKLTQGSK